jgi:Methyltransferase domain
MSPKEASAFNFGENWAEYSDHALSPSRLAEARADFAELFTGLPLTGGTFLDIGFGQGLSLLIATDSGARTVGCDINPKCAEVLAKNSSYFPNVDAAGVRVVVGSILDDAIMIKLREAYPGGDGSGGYDIVHSWGVLHHTGEMWNALGRAASLVNAKGHLIIAIYNRHWSSRIWWLIKWLYNHVPRLVQRLLIGLFYPVIYLAKFAVTGQNPKRQKRGMDFYYDVVDWVGGYPYEYASGDEIAAALSPLGFSLLRTTSPPTPTGCNEFVWRKTKPLAAVLQTGSIPDLRSAPGQRVGADDGV